MRIDNISDNNFRGKFIIPKPLPPKENKFVKELMNYRMDGKTNKEYIKGKNFNVEIYNRTKKRSSKHRLSFLIKTNYIERYSSVDRGIDMTQLFGKIIPINDNMYHATESLRELIDNADLFAENTPTQYNTKFQKFLIKTAMFIGIL